MADNVTLSAGSADGAVIATDDDGTAQHQYVKLEFGADNTQTKVSASAPLPVQISDGTDTALVDGSGNLQVGGTVTANLGATDNAVLDAIETATEATQAAVEVLDNAAYVDDADWTDGTSYHLLVGGLYQSTPQTVTDGDVAPFNITANGALHVAQQGTVTVSGTVTANLSATDNGVLDNIDGDLTTIIGHVDGIETLIGTTNTTLGTIDADTSILAGAVSGTEMQVDVVTSALPSGAATAAKQPALGTAGTASSDVISVQGIASMTPLTVDLGANNDVTVTGTVDLGATDNAVLDAIAASLALLDNAIATGNELQVDVVASLPAGDNNIGNVDLASAIPAGTNNIGDVDIASIAAGTNSIGNVGLVGRTSGGMSIFRSLDIDESEEEIKATAGQVFSITAFNTTAAPLYLKFYNATAANVSVGTTTPVLTFLVPGNADSDGAGFVWNNSIGFAFGTAISVACTTAIADADTGAPGANACLVNVGYA